MNETRDKKFSQKISHVGKNLYKVRKQGRDEKHPRATLLWNMAEKKDKEDYTMSIAKMCCATDAV